MSTNTKMRANQQKDFVDVLVSLAPTLNWLWCEQPVRADAVPSEHQPSVRQLETLGFVYKRNSHTYCLQKERLRKVLQRVLALYTCTTEYRHALGALFPDLLSGDAVALPVNGNQVAVLAESI